MDFWDTLAPINPRQALPPDFTPTPGPPTGDTGDAFRNFTQRVGSGLLNYLRWNMMGSPGGTPGEIGMGIINSAANAGRIMTTPALSPPAGSITDDAGMISQGRADPAAWQAFVRDQAERQNFAPRTALGMIGGGASFAERGALGSAGGRALTPAGQMAEHGLFDQAAPGIRAYHGSPYDFDRFDISKIDTGEGAQAYGHGIYLAEREATAKTYRNKLGGISVIDKNGEALPLDLEGDMLARHVHGEFGGDIEKALQFYRDKRPIQSNLDAISTLEKWKSAGAAPKQMGHMYEVNINANPEHFLDWDKPLGAQSPYVQERLGPLLADFNNKGTAVGEYIYRHFGRVEPKGEGNYKILQAPDERAASLKLFDTGIPGIKYLDQGSRTEGVGTRNYVVFDDKLIDIIKKYGIAGLGVYLGANQLPIPAQRQPVF